MGAVLTGTATSYASPASVVIPGTTLVGDVMLIGLCVSGDATHLPATPAGWTRVATNSETGGGFDTGALYRKTAVAGDIGSTVTFSSTGNFQAAVLRTYTTGGFDVSGNAISTANTVGQVSLTPLQGGESSVCFACLLQGNGANNVTYASGANNQVTTPKQALMVCSWDAAAGSAGVPGTAAGTINALTGGGNPPAWVIFSVLLETGVTAYSGSASDSMAYADTATATTNHHYASDSIAVVDSASAHEALLASASDTMAISDAASGATHSFTGSAADSVAYGDTGSGAQHGFSALTADSLSYADSGEAHNHYSATAGDSVAYTDEGAGYLVGAGAVDSIAYAESADGLINLRGASDSISYGDSVSYVFLPITDLPTPMVLNPDVATQTLKSDRTTLTLDPGVGTLAVRNEPTGIRIDGP